jgi:uncharacterized membrane protein YciS (DUF1049 family)
MVKLLPNEKSPRRMIFQWMTFKALIAIIIFVIFSIFIQWVIVLYSVNLGVKDTSVIQHEFQFPNSEWTITITISPLFHLIPTVVIITLLSSWTYLTKHIAVRHRRKQLQSLKSVKSHTKKHNVKGIKGLMVKVKNVAENGKNKLLQIRSIAYLWQKIHFARATIKSGLIVLCIFGLFIFIISLLTYPQIIYLAVKGSYQNNIALRNFVMSIGNLLHEIVSLPILNSIYSAINSGLLFIAPGFRGSVSQFGGLIEPLVKLPSSGKYLIFQNAATWISALIALFYGNYKQKQYRPIRKR